MFKRVCPEWSGKREGASRRRPFLPRTGASLYLPLTCLEISPSKHFLSRTPSTSLSPSEVSLTQSYLFSLKPLHRKLLTSSKLSILFIGRSDSGTFHQYQGASLLSRYCFIFTSRHQKIHLCFRSSWFRSDALSPHILVQKLFEVSALLHQHCHNQ